MCFINLQKKKINLFYQLSVSNSTGFVIFSARILLTKLLTSYDKTVGKDLLKFMFFPTLIYSFCSRYIYKAIKWLISIFFKLYNHPPITILENLQI